MRWTWWFDPLFIIPLVGLSSVSLAVIGSTNPALFPSQLTFFIIGAILYFICAHIDLRIFPGLRRYLYLTVIALLFIVFLGPNVRGSTRWIDIVGFRMQSSEIVKPLLFLVWAYLLSKGQSMKEKNKYFLFSFLLTLPVLGLIFKEPDLGNVIVFFGVYASLLFASGISFRFIFLSIIGSITGIPVFWSLLHDYQKSRIVSFLDPAQDPSGAGYNALQSMIAVGAGGLFGLGLGRGTQSHLLFLPEFHTDFVFASLVEELGFLGGFVTLGFYFILLGRILWIASKAEDTFERLLCLSVFFQILLQVCINIGMNIGILPITGITLPLVSYGGSSILSLCISLGLVVAVLRRRKTSYHLF